MIEYVAKVILHFSRIGTLVFTGIPGLWVANGTVHHRSSIFITELFTESDFYLQTNEQIRQIGLPRPVDSKQTIDWKLLNAENMLDVKSVLIKKKVATRALWDNSLWPGFSRPEHKT